MASEMQAGRAMVVIAAITGLLFFILGVVGDDSLFRAFGKGALSAFAVMVLGGTARRFWRGSTVESAQGPGGWGLNFARATLRPLLTLERRVDQQMAAVNERLTAIEEEVTILRGTAPA